MLKDLIKNIFYFKKNTFFYISEFKQVFISNILKSKNIKTQEGKNLGDKMKNAFISVYKNTNCPAILFGSDIPQIDKNLLELYIDKLKEFPAVIGPSIDGGYYLIGFQKKIFTEDTFKNVDWSTSKVYEQTISKFKKNNINYYTGPVLQDIDNAEDLKLVLKEYNGKACISNLEKWAEINIGSLQKTLY